MSLSFSPKEKIPLLEPNVYVGPPSFPVMSLFKEEQFYETTSFKTFKNLSPVTPKSPVEYIEEEKEEKQEKSKDGEYKINVGHWTREEHGIFYSY